MGNQTDKSIQVFEVAKQLNNSVFRVIGSEHQTGFEKAYLIASAAGELKSLLNDEYMKPIMELQGNKLGFKTDKDTSGGYPLAVVKNCLIEAVLTGVQPFGNQFNIIANNCYITKEGFGFLLSKVVGLKYKISFELPRINQGNTSAAVVAVIKWSMNGGEWQEEKIDFPVKVNSYMGADGVLGKAERKARKWLFQVVTGVEVGDGDVTDTDATVVSTKINGDTFVTLEDVQFLFEAKKGTMTTEDLVNANRIIGSREDKSYSKLYKHMQTL